ncbi:NAD(P)/FAD-dependent oxidoreductase, partial [Elusimicrobiota bacterium]
ITGNGRCNLTNSAKLQDFLKQFSDRGRFIKPVFCQFFNKDLIALINNLGVKTKIERGGMIFPKSDSSKEVLDNLLHWAKKCGVMITEKTSVKKLLVKDGKITGVKDTSGKKHRADAVILAIGGASYPGTGSSGDGYSIARQAGHTIKNIHPALVPVETEGSTAKELQGLTLKNVSANIYIAGKKEAEQFGEMIFTHYGVSGPIILTLSRLLVSSIKSGKETVISIDLNPALDNKQLDNRLLREFDANGKKQIKTTLQSLLPKKMIPVCLAGTGIPPDKKGHQINSEDRKKLRMWLKDFRLKVTGYRPIEDAIITAGGVSTSEINPHDMSSRIVKNLFFAGEVIDIDANTGGYNLQAAFSTGWAAGKSAAK